MKKERVTNLIEDVLDAALGQAAHEARVGLVQRVQLVLVVVQVDLALRHIQEVVYRLDVAVDKKKEEKERFRKRG